MATLRLLGVGEKPAIKASTLKVGDTMMWNYGYTSTIIGIAKETAATIFFNIRCNETGYIGVRKLRKNSLVVKVTND